MGVETGSLSTGNELWIVPFYVSLSNLRAVSHQAPLSTHDTACLLVMNVNISNSVCSNMCFMLGRHKKNEKFNVKNEIQLANFLSKVFTSIKRK